MTTPAVVDPVSVKMEAVAFLDLVVEAFEAEVPNIVLELAVAASALFLLCACERPTPSPSARATARITPMMMRSGNGRMNHFLSSLAPPPRGPCRSEEGW